MKRKLPQKCPRNLADCLPLCKIGGRKDFICVGLNFWHKGNDMYRSCFKTATTDTMYDMNEIDLLDVAEMHVRAVTMKKRL